MILRVKGLPGIIPLTPQAPGALTPAEAKAARRFALAYEMEVRLGSARNRLRPGLEQMRRRLRGD